MSSVELLDCTLRDGGYVNNWEFTNEQAVILYNTLAKNNVDIIEVGFRTTQNPEYLKKYGRFFFCDDALLDSVFEGVDIENGPKIAVMCQIGMSTLSDFAPKEQSKLSIVRVLLAYHSVKGTNDNEIDYDMLNEGCELINGLVALGYSVSINIGRIDKPSDEQLREICEILSRTGMQYFYMADTYGSTDLFSTEHYVKLIKSYFHDDFNRPDIKIGFHAHNNNKNAVYKALYAVKCGAAIIDGCVHGFGRGSGNAATELLMMDMNKNYGKKYDVVELLEYGQKYLTGYPLSNGIFNFDDIMYMLSAYYGMHVNHAVEMVEKHRHLTVTDVDTIFRKICKLEKYMYYSDKTISRYL